jgi:hypothetical protein
VSEQEKPISDAGALGREALEARVAGIISDVFLLFALVTLSIREPKSAAAAFGS